MNGWEIIAGSVISAAGILAAALKWIQHGLHGAIVAHGAALAANTVAVEANTAARKLPLLLLALLLTVAGCKSADPLTVRSLERNREVWAEDRRADLDPELIKSRETEFDAQLRYERSKGQ